MYSPTRSLPVSIHVSARTVAAACCCVDPPTAHTALCDEWTAGVAATDELHMKRNDDGRMQPVRSAVLEFNGRKVMKKKHGTPDMQDK